MGCGLDLPPGQLTVGCVPTFPPPLNTSGRVYRKPTTRSIPLTPTKYVQVCEARHEPLSPSVSCFCYASVRLERAVRCGRKKCVEFILWRMGADTEIPDYGGFTPLLNTGTSRHSINTCDSPNAEDFQVCRKNPRNRKNPSHGNGTEQLLGTKETRAREKVATFLCSVARPKQIGLLDCLVIGPV